LGNGSLYINTRSSTNTRLVAVSQDEGATWSDPVAQDELSKGPVCEGSLISVAKAAEGGRQTTLYYSHPSGTGRDHLMIWRSTDDGSTWHESLLVWPGKSAYSCLGTTAGGEVAVLWEKDGGDLGFARIAGF
jgi:hypothetical protein